MYHDIEIGKLKEKTKYDEFNILEKQNKQTKKEKKKKAKLKKNKKFRYIFHK